MPIMNIACPICTDIFNNSDDIYTTSCGHIFHYKCMRDWQSRSTSCPQCRSYNPSTHKLYLSFGDSDENTKEIDELKVKVESSTAEIKQLYDQIKEGDANFLHLQEQYTTSVELIRELEERIRQAKYSETDFLNLQGQYTKSDNLIKELQEQVQLLTITNEFSSKELSLKVTEPTTLKTSLEAIECPASDVILNDKIFEQKFKHLSAEFEKEIIKSTQLSIDKMKLQSYIDCMKLKANLNESIQMVSGDNSILTQQTNKNVDHSSQSNLRQNQFISLASNIGANIKESAKRGNLKIKSVHDQQNNNTLSMGIIHLGDIRNSNEPVLNSSISPLTCRQNEVFSSNNTTSVVIEDFPVLGEFSFGTGSNSTAVLATTTINSPKVIPPTTSLKPSAGAGFATFTKLPCTTNANVNNTLINFGTTPARENCNSVSISAFSVAPTSFSNAACTSSARLNLTSITSNTSTSSKPVAAFSFGTSALVSASAASVPTQINGSGVSDTNRKPNAGLNFGISSTTTSTASSVPTPAYLPAAVAVTTTNADTSSTLGFNSNTTATSSSGAPEFGVVAIKASNSLTSTSFSLTSSQSTTPTTNSSSGISTGGFNFGLNSTQHSSFAPNTSTAIKPQTTSSSTTASVSIGSATTDSNAVQSSLGNNTSVFNTGASSLFGAAQPAFGTSTSGSVFGSTATNSVQNVFGTSNATFKSLFRTGSSNSSTQSNGSVADNKTTSVFGSNSTNIKSTPFGFGSKSTNKPIANPSSTPTGGFFFGSAAANTSTIGAFAFGVASSESSVTNTFNSATHHSIGTMPSSGTVPKKEFAFGYRNNKYGYRNNNNNNNKSTKKQSKTIASPVGFSFGSVIAAKPSCSSSISFASSGNMSTTNIGSNAPSTRFAFGAGVPSKPANISDNKTFSLGTSPSPTPQSLRVPNKNASSSNSFASAPADKNVPPAFNFGASTNAPSTIAQSSKNLFAPSSTPQSLGVPNNNTSSSNSFTSAPAAKNVQPAFNFGASTNAQSTGAISKNSNIFAPTNSNVSSGPGDRPNRRARRRLQKLPADAL